jgi:hypothetical protein
MPIYHSCNDSGLIPFEPTHTTAAPPFVLFEGWGFSLGLGPILGGAALSSAAIQAGKRRGFSR